MPMQRFEPKFMKIGVLTAALQELTPREVRDKDPDRAIEEWLDFARELGVDCIQLSAALHPSESDVPPEAMLDPVANTLDLRKPFDKARARRVEAALNLRQAWRGRSVSHSLRPIARDSDGAGHAVDLPIPERRGLRLSDRRLPCEGPGDRREGSGRLGLRWTDS